MNISYKVLIKIVYRYDMMNWKQEDKHISRTVNLMIGTLSIFHNLEDKQFYKANFKLNFHHYYKQRSTVILFNWYLYHALTIKQFLTHESQIPTKISALVNKTVLQLALSQFWNMKGEIKFEKWIKHLPCYLSFSGNWWERMTAVG